MNDLIKVLLGLVAISSPLWGLLLLGAIDQRFPNILNRILPDKDSK